MEVAVAGVLEAIEWPRRNVVCDLLSDFNGWGKMRGGLVWCWV